MTASQVHMPTHGAQLYLFELKDLGLQQSTTEYILNHDSLFPVLEQRALHSGAT